MRSRPCSEFESQGKLENARVQSTGDLTEVARIQRCADIPKVRMVPDIEELRTELQPDSLPDRKSLIECPIPHIFPGTADHACPAVTEEAVSRRCKGARVEPLRQCLRTGH